MARLLKPLFTLPETVTGFHQYFAFTADTETVLEALGYTFTCDTLNLPRRPQVVGSWADHLRVQVPHVLRRIAMNAEITRREFLIAPLLQSLRDRDGVAESIAPCRTLHENAVDDARFFCFPP